MKTNRTTALFCAGGIRLFFLGLLAAALSACGGGGGKASQVAVKVNKDEITVSQINDQLAHLPAGIPADRIELARGQIIGRLVNEQLLVQQALEHKLDRDPAVLGALQAARANVLSQAYMQRVIAPQAKVSEEEVHKYYADNPDLFSQRKVYRLAELSIAANAEQQKSIQEAARGKSLKQLADFLAEHKIGFSAESGVRTAEQLPLAHLPQIAQMKSGGVLVYASGPDRVSAIEVLASEPRPVDEKTATPAIEKFLTNVKREELAVNEIKRLREVAKIEYVGDFAKYASSAASAAAPSTSAEKPAASDQDKGIAALH